ncbi:MAG: hypothetical protein JXR34_07675 [Bacteroidales bacterium]|nr:hypothetical protein [Bacteroidales bacterium]
MDDNLRINEKWVKAAIIGTGWAALEIVFGSFLHNLRVPFSGNILTSLGLIVLISASYRWKENGLFWRAGLITALMKSLSPSAVIFGPMVAIFTEALLFDISMRLFGRTITGYVLGSVFAMTWVLFQRIFNLILFYGSNLVDVYTNLIEMAENQLHIESDLVWLPIFLLLIVQIIMGVLAAIIGVKAGRSLFNSQSSDIIPHQMDTSSAQIKNDSYFSYSMVWLWLNVSVIVLTLFLHSKTAWFVWMPLTIAMVIIWSIRYKSALRHLKKPKFWIFFFVITLFATLAFSSFQRSETLLNGLLIGVQMNFRAVIVIVGFSVVGKELYNPKVVSFFRKSAYRQLHLALELSFSSVPQVIASLPKFKEFVKNPLDGVSHLINNAEYRIEQMRQKAKSSPFVFLVTGEIGSGKTELCQQIYSTLSVENYAVGGVLSKKNIQNEQFIGYDLILLSEKNSYPFMQFKEFENQEGIGRFTFNNKAFDAGNQKILSDSKICTLLMIDEVGNLELNGGGWAMSLEYLMNNYQGVLLLSVRYSALEEIAKMWHISNMEIVDLKDVSFSELLSKIREKIQ